MGMRLLYDGICRLAWHADAIGNTLRIDDRSRPAADISMSAASLPYRRFGLLFYCMTTARQLGSSEHEWTGHCVALINFGAALVFTIYIVDTLQK